MFTYPTAVTVCSPGSSQLGSEPWGSGVGLGLIWIFLEARTLLGTIAIYTNIVDLGSTRV